MSLAIPAKERFAQFLEDERIISKGDKIIVACSGGADSVALMYLLGLLRFDLKLSLLAVHIDHQTRPGANEAEAELVKEICRKLNVALVIRKIKPEPGSGFENRARDLRFSEFEHILRLYNFNKLALGHHKNDQAETVLMNLFRGAGVGGMGGIKPILGHVVHPLLCFRKKELTDLLSSQSIPWMEDASNSDIRLRRNYLRNEIIPLLEEKVHPAVVEKIALQAAISREAEAFFREQAKQRFKRLCIDQSPSRIVLKLKGLTNLSSIEQFYTLRRVYSLLSETEQDFYWHSFGDIRELYGEEGSKETMLQKGIRVERRYEELIFYTALDNLASPPPEPVIVEEDRSRVVWGNMRFSFKHIRVLPKHDEIDRHNIYLDADKVVFPLVIRSREEGDRFMPSGMQNFKKLKDFFIDEKVAKNERDRMALVCDSEKILWIAGMRMDQRALPGPQSTHYLQVHLESMDEKPNRAASRHKKQGENE